MKNVIIDFKTLGGPVYSGRPRGAALRERLDLDNLDEDQSAVVNVSVPDSTYSMTSSFFLGLFGPSVARAGTREKFFGKYNFHAKPVLQKAFDDYVDIALQTTRLFN
jgi:hypothetical protein